MFKLAAHLGKTVGEIEHSMSYREFIEWADHYSKEPFMSDRMELQLSAIGQLLAGVHGVKLEDGAFMVREINKPTIEDKLKKIFGE